MLATSNPFGPAPRLAAKALERTLTSDDLREYLQALPAASVPRVVVMVNAGMRGGKAFKARRKELAGQGIDLDSLPA